METGMPDEPYPPVSYILSIPMDPANSESNGPASGIPSPKLFGKCFQVNIPSSNSTLNGLENTSVSSKLPTVWRGFNKNINEFLFRI